MYDSKNKRITFPHVIPTPMLDGKRYTINDAQGGAVKIVDLGIQVNSFYGGNCHSLVMISDLGFYICPHRETREVLGFYVHDWKKVTPKGQEVLKRRFPDCDVIFSDEVFISEDLSEARKRKEELRKEALEHGIAAEMISHTTAEELDSLIKAMNSGVASRKMAVAQDSVVSSYATDDDSVEELRAVPDQIVQKATRKQSRNMVI